MGVNLLSEYFQNILYTVKSALSGMSLTWEHFINKKKYVSTLQYPNEKWPQPERNIGFDHSEYNVIRSRLHVDIDDCIGCLQCEKACPVDCIKIDTIKPPKNSEYDCGKTSHDTQKKMIVPRFTIDMSECMYCNLCVYPCPEECIFMVGGPNEPKHEIDYEFSKYVKHDLLFEFSNTTEQEIVDIGGQSYLDKRTEIENRMSEGNQLKGGVESEENNQEELDSSKSNKHVDPGFSVFTSVNDKMSRGIAKKAYTFGKRNNMDMVSISKYVEEAINSYNKMSPDMDEAIKAIIDFKYPEDSIDLKPEHTEVKTTKNLPPSDSTLFDIKLLNDISDKMIRGSLKKIYMGGKRNNKSTSDVIIEMTNHLNENDNMNDDIKSLFEKIDVPTTDDNLVKKQQNPLEQVLFEIKDLNSIEDKVVRGTAKKIYMAGKRSGKKSTEIIDDIINSLKDSDKLNSDIEKKLDELR